MFFPFTNYKKDRIDFSGSTTVFYTTTATSMLVFQPDTNGNHDGTVLIRVSPGKDLAISQPVVTDSGVQLVTMMGAMIVQAGVGIEAQATGGTEVHGTLHIFELP